MSQSPTVLPVPNGPNLYAAIRLLAEGDPLAGVFARGVLQSFRCFVPDDHRARLRALLDLWDTVLLEREVPTYDPALIAAARAQVEPQ